ncbi:hypothetical protein D3C87_2160530 [compost metagenome]
MNRAKTIDMKGDKPGDSASQLRPAASRNPPANVCSGFDFNTLTTTAPAIV